MHFLDFARRAAMLAAAAWAGLPLAVAADYDQREEVRQFVAAMSDRHGFSPDALMRLFHQAQFQPGVIKAITPPRDPRVRSWRAYRSRYLDEARISGGLQFWEDHAAVLAQAQRAFGVPQEIIVAIIGVETLYGRMTGGYQTLSALTTLAFDYPPRAELFRGELEELLLLARETQTDATDFHGSYAGALGLPQFLPSSYRRYAVDFDGDGRVDLGGSAADAIGSVANFLQQHGWRTGGRIALRAKAAPERLAALADGSVAPRYSSKDLAQHGIVAASDVADGETVALIDLVTPDLPTEYWFGFQNFYVLTRYNRSSFYAMAVYQLAQTLAEERTARQTGYRGREERIRTGCRETRPAGAGCAAAG